MVLRSNDIDSLADFAAHYDPRGARTFACLLYTLDRRESALYWWRFAAGREGPLAAHLVAAHHAAVGVSLDAGCGGRRPACWASPATATSPSPYGPVLISPKGSPAPCPGAPH
ncbi:hypothetical protein [Streptomyces mirabilis]|uniref:hypothetical protein n=1 Tax=Streptomyces mirabilis TaxID=68239 RepID=UPI0036BE735D